MCEIKAASVLYAKITRNKNPLKLSYFQLHNVALDLSIQQSIFDLLKLFWLSSRRLVSSFSKSNT